MARAAPPRIQCHRARMARSGNHRATRCRLAGLVAIETALLRSQRLFALSLRCLLHAGRAPLIVVPATKGAAHSRCTTFVRPSPHHLLTTGSAHRSSVDGLRQSSHYPRPHSAPRRARIGPGWEMHRKNAQVSKNNGRVFSPNSPFSRFAPPLCFVRARLRSTTSAERNAFGPQLALLTEYSV